MAEIPQKSDFLTWSIQNFLTRKKLSLMKKLTNINQCLTDIFKI